MCGSVCIFEGEQFLINYEIEIEADKQRGKQIKKGTKRRWNRHDFVNYRIKGKHKNTHHCHIYMSLIHDDQDFHSYRYLLTFIPSCFAEIGNNSFYISER